MSDEHTVSMALMHELMKQMQVSLSQLVDGQKTILYRLEKIEHRLSAVESHMSGTMSTLRYHDTELDEYRGRLEALEDSTPPK